MTAVQLGPFVLSTPRFAALLALVAFLAVAHLLERRRPGVSDWAWTSAVLVLLGARGGFVLENLSAYLREPLTALYFWQGGFSPVWGFAAAALYTVWRRAWSRHALALAALGLLTWGGTLTLLTPAEQARPSRPDTPLLTLAGEPTDLGRIAAGRPLVVNLWAPWCLPCRRETPMVLDVAAAHPEVPFALADQGSPAHDVTAFLGERGLPHGSVYRDPTARLGVELRTVGLPTTLFFAADGTLVHTHVGEISRAELERRVRGLRD